MYFFRILSVFIAYAAAGPVTEPESARHEVARPLMNQVFSLPRHPRSGFGIFRRQGDCPILSQTCASGICCSYEGGPCCGNTCCDATSVCAGTDNSGSPCCVEIGASSNTCGSSKSNPCANYPGTILCSNINVCCPPNNVCYYDSNNIPRCAPQGSINPPSSSSYVPVRSITISSSSATTPIPIYPTTTYTSSSTSFSPTPTPNYFGTDSSSSSVTNNFWAPATIGGVAAGSVVFVILLLVGLLAFCCVKKRWGGSTGRNHSKEKPKVSAQLSSKQPAFTPITEISPVTVIPPEKPSHRDPVAGSHIPTSSTIKDLPRDEGGYESTNIADIGLTGTEIYDPIMIPPLGRPPSKEESEKRDEMIAAVNKANQGLYKDKKMEIFKGAGKIRILVLEPNENRKAPIICRMTPVQLDSTKYEALSYTWGEPFSRSEIKINDFMFSVTKTLESTLQHLRCPTEERLIWIDAICINQSSESEINWHMEFMRDVYKNATQTLIWLGEGTPASDTVITFFNESGRCYATVSALLKDYELHKREWGCLQDILERPWWSRLWIVQEVIVSRRPLILCGDHSIIFAAIPKMLGIAMKHNLDIFSYSTFLSQYRRNINLLQHFRLVYGFKQACFDPKDKIKGLRALAKDNGAFREYFLSKEQPVSDGFTKATTHIISQKSQGWTIGKDLDFICLGRGARRNQNFGSPKLPSWVPDLTLAPWDSYPTLTRKSWLSGFPRELQQKGDDFHASYPDKIRLQPVHIPGIPRPVGGNLDLRSYETVQFADSGRVLKVQGFVVEKIHILGQEHDLKLTPKNLKQETLTRSQFEHHHEVLAEIKRLLNTAKQDHGEQYPRGNCTYDWAVSKTLVCDRNARNQRLTPQEPGFKDFEIGGSDALAELHQGRFDEHSMDLHFQRVHRRFMVGTKGHIGLVPPESQMGDIVCVIFGCSVPVVLRPNIINMREELEVSLEFIGECYVHGIMDGEIVMDWSEGKAAAVDFEIQ